MKINSETLSDAIGALSDGDIASAEKPLRAKPRNPFSMQFTGVAAAVLVFAFGTAFMFHAFRPDGGTPTSSGASATADSTTPVVPEPDYVWIVEPTIEYEYGVIIYCIGHDHFQNSNQDLIDENTGLLTGEVGCVHGGNSRPWWIYDSELDLFGVGANDYDETPAELYPMAEYIEHFAQYKDTIKLVQLVDSPDGFYGVAVGNKFVTDFIYGTVNPSRYVDNVIVVSDVNSNEKRGLIDRNGEITVPFEFEELLIISENTAFAKVDGKWGIIGFNGYEPDDLPVNNGCTDCGVWCPDSSICCDYCHEGNCTFEPPTSDCGCLYFCECPCEVCGYGKSFYGCHDECRYVEPDEVRINTTIREQFERDLASFEYEAQEVNGIKNYVKTFDGFLTNDFYDVLEDGTIIKSRNTITHDDIAEARTQKLLDESKFKVEETMTLGTTDWNLTKTKEYLYYVKIDGQMIPVKVIYASYVRYVNERERYNPQTICINLIDGSYMNYEDILIEKWED